MGSLFTITQGKGFHIEFSNGFAVSVQFGPGNYCDNRNMGFNEPMLQLQNTGRWASNDAEVAVFYNHEFVRNIAYGDDVVGRVKSDDVAALIGMLAAIPAGHIDCELILTNIQKILGTHEEV